MRQKLKNIGEKIADRLYYIYGAAAICDAAFGLYFMFANSPILSSVLPRRYIDLSKGNYALGAYALIFSGLLGREFFRQRKIIKSPEIENIIDANF